MLVRHEPRSQGVSQLDIPVGYFSNLASVELYFGFKVKRLPL
jgi:hypothetical protein